MYSLISRIVAVPGKRDALAQILMKASGNVAGCLDYVVANDPSDESLVWIDEVWESEASRRSALSLAQVKEATRDALPMIAGVGDGRHERG